jgi:hypothetical protein
MVLREDDDMMRTDQSTGVRKVQRKQSPKHFSKLYILASDLFSR